jgi:hypothetical protein
MRQEIGQGLGLEYTMGVLGLEGLPSHTKEEGR